jgi:hypothetical protein
MTVEVESKKEAKDRGRRHAVPGPILPKEMTMKVRMLTTRTAAPDGLNVREFEAGKTYELPASLAEPWLAAKVCEQDKMGKGPSEKKDGSKPK